MNRVLFLLIIVLFIPYILSGQENVAADTSYTLNEAVVYSFREGNEVKKLPASTSIVTTRQIDDNRIESLKDLTSYIPNFFMPDYGSQLTSPVFIRGIGSRINSPSIGLYVDYIPYFDKATFDFDLYDIQHIEILRGPQGTLYGRNTMGGIINVFSLSPIDYQGTILRFSAGNYKYIKGGFSHYQTLNSKSGLSFAIDYTHNGGHYTNKFNGEKTGKKNIGSAKARYVYNISNSVSTQLYAQYEHSEQKGYPYALLDKAKPKDAVINYNEESLYNRDFFTAGGLVEWKTPNFILRSTTAYSYMEDKQQVDQDYTPASICLATQTMKNNMLSEEILIKSNTANNYQWLFGAFGFWQQSDQNVFLDFKKDAVNMGMPIHIQDMTYDNPTYGWAIFHQSKINNLFTKGLSVVAGVRLDGEYAKSAYQKIMLVKPKGDTTTLDSKLDYLQVLPKFTIDYKPSSVYSVYISVAKGYKTGGFNSAVEDMKDVTFKPEYSWNYEAGLKFNLLNNRITTEASVFYIDWRDQQIYQFNPSGVGSILRNAGKSESKGFELLMKVIPARLLSVTASYGYTHATFKNYKNDKKGVITDYSGNYIPYVPRHTLSVNANYSIFLNNKIINNIDMNAQYLGTGSLYWDEANLNKQSFYNQFNAKVSLEILQHAELGIWAQNIFNTKYQTFYFEALGKSFVQYNKPFLCGIDLKISF